MNYFDVGVHAATTTRATATSKAQKEGSKKVKSIAFFHSFSFFSLSCGKATKVLALNWFHNCGLQQCFVKRTEVVRRTQFLAYCTVWLSANVWVPLLLHT